MGTNAKDEVYISATFPQHSTSNYPEDYPAYNGDFPNHQENRSRMTTANQIILWVEQPMLGGHGHGGRKH